MKKKIEIEKTENGFRITFLTPAVFGTAGESLFAADLETVFALIKCREGFLNTMPN